jgi:hypothetical protein
MNPWIALLEFLAALVTLWQTGPVLLKALRNS